jgi:hypothetical protein
VFAAGERPDETREEVILPPDLEDRIHVGGVVRDQVLAWGD